MAQKVLVMGGTGFIGVPLVRELRQAGFEPLIFSHDGKGGGMERIVIPNSDGLIAADVLAETAAIINLAGENIGQRWSREAKARILSSRVVTTKNIVRSLQHNRENGKACPRVLINASAVGYYGTHPQGIVTEASPSGDGYLAEVCREWEKTAQQVELEGLRVVILRFGIVLGPGGGVLKQMERPFRWGVGGIIGSGQQYISWVHRGDLIRVILKSLENENLAGIYNLTSPNPVTMAEFMKELGRVLHSACWTQMPSFVAKIIFGERAGELLLASQQVLPQRLLTAQYEFQFAKIEQALENVYRNQGAKVKSIF
jgi:hypothetical protein